MSHYPIEADPDDDLTPDELREKRLDDAYDWQLEWKRGE